MQRRLTVAMVGIALAAVVFVGAGVLTLAQFGARSDTEDAVRDGLAALTALTERSGTVETLRNVGDVRDAFGLNDLGVVLVTDQGEVYRLQNLGPPRRDRDRPRANNRGNDLNNIEKTLLFTMNESEFDLYGTGVPLFVDDNSSRRRAVVGVQRLPDASTADLVTTDSLGLVARRNVVTVADGARLWFLLSATAMLAIAAVAASLLARRFTQPIREIEQATAGIAAGDFDVRVAAKGDDELAQLGRSVNRMATDLERSRALDQQFLMSVSHDLRTPLTAISGYAEALRDGAVTDVVHTGEIIGNHADRLERLVGDLLDLARLDANRFTFHLGPVDAAVVVGRTVAGLAPRAEAVGVALRTGGSGSLPVVADPDRLAQCVGNVIDNALKFASTAVTVTAVADGAAARIDVADDGPGIAAADLPHVFERLYVGSSQPERAENPTGMGLAIVRELMTAMGGSVTVASTEGAGTTMSLHLPLRTDDGGRSL
ncbi:MAG: HAMP domain-containing sensor histidine kinase [Actinomycetota bacterium]